MFWFHWVSCFICAEEWWTAITRSWVTGNKENKKLILKISDMVLTCWKRKVGTMVAPQLCEERAAGGADCTQGHGGASGRKDPGQRPTREPFPTLPTQPWGCNTWESLQAPTGLCSPYMEATRKRRGQSFPEYFSSTTTKQCLSRRLQRTKH